VNLAGLIGLSKDLGPRFNIVGLLPAAALTLFVLGLVWGGAPDQTPDLARIGSRASRLDGFEIAMLFLGLVIVVLIIQPFQLALIRLLEGYWGSGRIGRALAAKGRERQAQLRSRLVEKQTVQSPDPLPESLRSEMADAAGRLLRLYPPGHMLMPTALGNVLRAAEDRAGRKYGLDAVVLWPRLYPLLPGGIRATVNDGRDQLDLAGSFCVASAIAAVVSFGLLVTHGVWVLVAVAAVLVSYVSYRGAVAAAVGYGESFEAAFDLHRFDLLHALHLPLPETRSSEREANRALSDFLRQGIPTELEYEHGGSVAEGEVRSGH
jgi:hypothetical protein